MLGLSTIAWKLLALAGAASLIVLGWHLVDAELERRAARIEQLAVELGSVRADLEMAEGVNRRNAETVARLEASIEGEKRAARAKIQAAEQRAEQARGRLAAAKAKRGTHEDAPVAVVVRDWIDRVRGGAPEAGRDPGDRGGGAAAGGGADVLPPALPPARR